MASVVKKYCGNFETGPGTTGLSSKLQLQTEQLKKAAIYFVFTVGAFTIVNKVLHLLQPVWTRLTTGTSQIPSVSVDDTNSKAELLIRRKGQGNEKSLASEINSRKPPDLWNTAFFFPDPDHNNPEMPDSSTRKLLHLLDSAQISIKVCMFINSCGALRKKIVQKFKEGLIIQVCMCRKMAKRDSYLQVRAFTMEGIPVRMKRNMPYLMHNKFVLIDDEAVITGSLNWTEQGISHNHENVLVTTDPRIVSPYRKEFANLWNNYNNIS